MDAEILAMLSAVAVALAGVPLVLWLVRPKAARAKETLQATRSQITLECSVCHSALTFSRKELRPLTPVERGLIVRSMPGALKYKLAEFVCPRCDAAHCFEVSKRTPRYLGRNFYEPQLQAAHCSECRVRLVSPPWSPGAYDGHLREAPDLKPNFGLACPWCHSVSCISCCEKHTRRRTEDGSLLCPRCDRGPQEIFYCAPHT